MKNDKKNFNAIEKSLKILSIFSIDAPAYNLSEISAITGFNASTTHRILNTLMEYGYIIRLPDKRYSIGTQPLYLSAIYTHTNHLEQIRPVVNKIRDLSQETASFFVEEDSYRICLYRAHSHDEIRHNIEQGTRLKLNQGSAGRVILAYGQRRHDKNGLFKKIRDNGYYLSINEHNPSLFSISIPVISQSKKFIGSLTISGPISRFNEQKKISFLSLLKAQLATISIP